MFEEVHLSKSERALDGQLWWSSNKESFCYKQSTDEVRAARSRDKIQEVRLHSDDNLHAVLRKRELLGHDHDPADKLEQAVRTVIVAILVLLEAHHYRSGHKRVDVVFVSDPDVTDAPDQGSCDTNNGILGFHALSKVVEFDGQGWIFPDGSPGGFDHERA